MILHLDMDAFFASVEQMDNPELRGKPLIIGAGERGVVSTASYEARVFGVHSAMPLVIARKLCPDGIFIPGRMRRYSEISRKIMHSLSSFSPVVQQASIDEAYLDISGMRHIWPRLSDIGAEIKKSVAAVSGGLTCSIGIAPAKYLAKMCSDINKPDGIFILMPKEVDNFLCALPIEKLPGVGKRMSANLRSYGIFNVAQLRALSRDFLLMRYGKSGAVLYDKARGIDTSIVHENMPAKSESSENTFLHDTYDRDVLAAALLKHAERVGTALRRRNYSGRTITLKIKFSNFKQITRSRTLGWRVNSTQTIYGIAISLLAGIDLDKPVRLIGVGVSSFEERQEQLPLFPDEREKYSRFNEHAEEDSALRKRQNNLDIVVDELKQRFGANVIHRASAAYKDY